MKKVLILLYVITLNSLVGCTNSETKKNTYDDTANTQTEAKDSLAVLEQRNNTKTEFQNLNCDSLLHLIVKSSNLSEELKNDNISIDNYEDDTALIKIYHENEAEKDAMTEEADAWLKIDFKNRVLLEQSLEDEDKVQELKCDSNALKFFIYNFHKLCEQG